MKNFLSVIFLMGLVQTAFASDIVCTPEVSVPDSVATELQYPSCIGLSKKLAIIAGYADQGQVLKVVSLENSKIVTTLKKSQVQKNTLAEYALKGNCGLALMTSKIISETEALVVFDNLNVLKWNFKENKASTLNSTYDPKTMYFCSGLEAGVDNYNDVVKLDTKKRTLTLQSLSRNDQSVVIKY